MTFDQWTYPIQAKIWLDLDDMTREIIRKLGITEQDWIRHEALKTVRSDLSHRVWKGTLAFRDAMGVAVRQGVVL